MAAAPESLTEQQRQPFASSRNSVASDSGASGDDTDIARPLGWDGLVICLFSERLRRTFDVSCVTKFIHDNCDLESVLVSVEGEARGKFTAIPMSFG